MAMLPKEHSKLYFDTLCRTQKAETVLALIKATYNAYKVKITDIKKEVALRLKSAYDLLKNSKNGVTGSGTYTGSVEQFESQYTIGHEMSIWHSKDLQLNYEAMLVACDFITIKDYFDIVFKNYVQIIDGKVYHPLYEVLNYLKVNNVIGISVSKIQTLFDGKCDLEGARSLANFLVGTSFFELSTLGRESKLIYSNNNISIEELIVQCNKKYLLEDGYEKIKNDLKDSLSYENYIFNRKNNNILFPDKTKDEVRTLFRNWLKSKLNYYPSDGYNGYDSMLFQIFEILESSKIINADCFHSNKKEFFFILKELYYENIDALNKDNSQNNPARAAFPFYSIFIQQIILYGYSEIERGISNDLSIKDLTKLNQNNNGEDVNIKSSTKKIFDYKCSNRVSTNLIVYGTPGCGKSYYVKNTLLNGYLEENCIRTTFYQDYTNTDFVGQIMPVVNGDKVTYEFNPGPFALALNKAIQNPDLPVALVIEELNRGNAASIFGDIFQLLDRENGISVYNITNVNIQKYLQEQNSDYSFEYIKLPSNLSIFATMNTSDQNVFTLDTAFKRRWKFEKLKNTFDKHSYATKLIPGMDLDWKEFCTAINNFIIESKDEITNSEDKQLGVYFIDEKGLRTENVTSDEVQRKEFAYKIFEYLWDDVVKYDRTVLFKDAKTLDDLIDNYVKSGSNDIDGKNVFVENIFKKNGN